MNLSPDVLKLALSFLRTVAEEGGRKLVLDEAEERLTKDGVFARLNTPGPYTDKDGDQQTGNENFLHEVYFAFPRAVFGGWIADKIRDAYFNAIRSEADVILTGKTGRAALEAAFNRLVEQI